MINSGAIERLKVLGHYDLAMDISNFDPFVSFYQIQGIWHVRIIRPFDDLSGNICKLLERAVTTLNS